LATWRSFVIGLLWKKFFRHGYRKTNFHRNSGHDQAFLQVVNAVESLHRLTPPVFHCDIKPQNVRFHNNLLKIIDFDTARSGIKSRVPLGDVRFQPNYALNAMNAREGLSCLDVLDLHLTVITFLEILIRTFFKNHISSEPIEKIKNAIEKKDKADELEYESKLRDYKAANADMLAAIDEWYKIDKTNKLVEMITALLINPTTNRSYTKCAELLSTSLEDLYKCSLRVVEQKSKSLLTSSSSPYELAENMEYLLGNVTSSIFGGYYPLIYLDYSKTYGSYDRPAAEAAKTARILLTSVDDPKPCLDVGSAFGTAAFRCAEEGFSQISCLDNNPVWKELFELLWSQNPPRGLWEDTAEKLLTEDFLEIGSQYLGRSKSETKTHFKELMLEKQKQLAPYTSYISDFDIADYWSLNERIERYQ
jgi:hypothetical protein